MDVHRDFCEVAIKDGTKLRSGGRIKTSVAELELFAQSLGARRPGRARGIGAGACDQAHHRAPRRAGGGRQHEEGARDRRGEGEDRQGRRHERFASCSTRAFCRASSAPTSGPARCAGACSAARSSCAQGRGQRTSCTPCWPATSKGARRCRTCSARRDASGLRQLELPPDERETVDGCSAPGRLPRRGGRR